MNDTYTHGHHDSVLRSPRWRTAENSAAYLLPHLRPGMDLLDVGCGPGTITVDLAARVSPGRVTGIDREHSVVAEATRLLEASATARRSSGRVVERPLGRASAPLRARRTGHQLRTEHTRRTGGGLQRVAPVGRTRRCLLRGRPRGTDRPTLNRVLTPNPKRQGARRDSPSHARQPTADLATLTAAAGAYEAGGWPAHLEGDAIAAPYRAQSAGPARLTA